MNIVLKYTKYTFVGSKYLRMLFDYRSETLNKYLGTTKIRNHYARCPKGLPLNAKGLLAIKGMCSKDIFSDCDKCWTHILENLDEYIDKSTDLPKFMQQAKKINDRKPSFLKR